MRVKSMNAKNMIFNIKKSTLFRSVPYICLIKMCVQDHDVHVSIYPFIFLAVHYLSLIKKGAFQNQKMSKFEPCPNLSPPLYLQLGTLFKILLLNKCWYLHLFNVSADFGLNRKIFQNHNKGFINGENIVVLKDIRDFEYWASSIYYFCFLRLLRNMIS